MWLTNAKKCIFVKCSLTSKPNGLLIHCFFLLISGLIKASHVHCRRGASRMLANSQPSLYEVLFISYVQCSWRDPVVKSNPQFVSKLALHYFSQKTGMLLSNAKKCIFVKCSLTSKPNGLVIIQLSSPVDFNTLPVDCRNFLVLMAAMLCCVFCGTKTMQANFSNY